MNIIFIQEMQSESIESQLAEEKCLMEQKYASMLQQVLAEKQLVGVTKKNVCVCVWDHKKYAFESSDPTGQSLSPVAIPTNSPDFPGSLQVFH